MRRESGNPAARTNAGVRASVAGPSGGVSAEIVDEVGQDQSFLDVHAALHNAVATGWPRSVGAGWMPSVPRIVFTTGSALYVLAYLGFAIGGHGLPCSSGPSRRLVRESVSPKPRSPHWSPECCRIACAAAGSACSAV